MILRMKAIHFTVIILFLSLSVWSQNITSLPTASPSFIPTISTTEPTVSPTLAPIAPTFSPTLIQTRPTKRPTAKPTRAPVTKRPTRFPTSLPTLAPIPPTAYPTSQPSSRPTSYPTGQPTSRPTSQPTSRPTAGPTGQPTTRPTSQPTSRPTKCFTKSNPYSLFTTTQVIQNVTFSDLNSTNARDIITETILYFLPCTSIHLTQVVEEATSRRHLSYNIHTTSTPVSHNSITYTVSYMYNNIAGQTAVYNTISTTLNNAITSGNFTLYLQGLASFAYVPGFDGVYSNIAVISPPTTPTLSPITSSKSSSTAGLSTGAIIGIVIGAVIGCCCIWCMTSRVIARRRKVGDDESSSRSVVIGTITSTKSDKVYHTARGVADDKPVSQSTRSRPVSTQMTHDEEGTWPADTHDKNNTPNTVVSPRLSSRPPSQRIPPSAHLSPRVQDTAITISSPRTPDITPQTPAPPPHTTEYDWLEFHTPPRTPDKTNNNNDDEGDIEVEDLASTEVIASNADDIPTRNKATYRYNREEEEVEEEEDVGTLVYSTPRPLDESPESTLRKSKYISHHLNVASSSDKSQNYDLRYFETEAGVVDEVHSIREAQTGEHQQLASPRIEAEEEKVVEEPRSIRKIVRQQNNKVYNKLFKSKATDHSNTPSPLFPPPAEPSDDTSGPTTLSDTQTASTIPVEQSSVAGAGTTEQLFPPRPPVTRRSSAAALLAPLLRPLTRRPREPAHPTTFNPRLTETSTTLDPHDRAHRSSDASDMVDDIPPPSPRGLTTGHASTHTSHLPDHFALPRDSEVDAIHAREVFNTARSSDYGLCNPPTRVAPAADEPKIEDDEPLLTTRDTIPPRQVHPHDTSTTDITAEDDGLMLTSRAPPDTHPSTSQPHLHQYPTPIPTHTHMSSASEDQYEEAVQDDRMSEFNHGHAVYVEEGVKEEVQEEGEEEDNNITHL